MVTITLRRCLDRIYTVHISFSELLSDSRVTKLVGMLWLNCIPFPYVNGWSQKGCGLWECCSFMFCNNLAVLWIWKHCIKNCKCFVERNILESLNFVRLGYATNNSQPITMFQMKYRRGTIKLKMECQSWRTFYVFMLDKQSLFPAPSNG